MTRQTRFGLAATAPLVLATCSGGEEPATDPPTKQDIELTVNTGDGAQDDPQADPASDRPTTGNATPTSTPAPEPSASGETRKERRADEGSVQAAVPARFRGTFAENTTACVQRNHGNFTVTADQIQFFESRGIVSRVRVDGDYAALTVSEAYADSVNNYIFYLALEGDDGLRFRYDKNERQTWVRCA